MNHKKLLSAARLADGNNLENRIRNEYLCIVGGDSWVSDRDIVSTPNETARGNISSNLSRVIVEGGIYRHL